MNEQEWLFAAALPILFLIGFAGGFGFGSAWGRAWMLRRLHEEDAWLRENGKSDVRATDYVRSGRESGERILGGDADRRARALDDRARADPADPSIPGSARRAIG